MANQRTKVAMLVISGMSMIGIAVHEGYIGHTYTDAVGVKTIGFGNTDGVKPGQTITVERALLKMGNNVTEKERAMKACLGDVPLYQHEWDAYVSLTYNIGIGKSGVSDGFCYAKRGGYSGLVTALRQTPPNYPGACAQILRWNRGGGRVLDGLTKRRRDEYNKCVGGV